MSEDKVGTLSERAYEVDGRRSRMLVLPDNSWVHVDSDLDHETLKQRYRLDRIEVAPRYRSER